MTQRRLRIRTIRRAAWAAGGALFAAAWLALFVQLAQGHDPALSSKRIAAIQPAPPLPSPAAPPAVSVDPQTGQPVDPQTGQPIDPQQQQQQGTSAAPDPNAPGPAPVRSRQS